MESIDYQSIDFILKKLKDFAPSLYSMVMKYYPDEKTIEECFVKADYDINTEPLNELFRT